MEEIGEAGLQEVMGTATVDKDSDASAVNRAAYEQNRAGLKQRAWMWWRKTLDVAERSSDRITFM